ncbi:MAG: hypothetical protein ACJA2S_001639 [Cyclobacteriaceae bacterium]|jgi:hypothetical protein
MNLEISTPALLFPAITLLLLAYTNRFLAVATLIRSLYKRYNEDGHERIIAGQIKNLRLRMYLIRNMQAFGILSFLLTVVCMFLLFENLTASANYLFGASLFSLFISLILSLIEIQLSTKALDLELKDMEE